MPLNPNGKVPVPVDGDFVLWESRAINGYLASLRPERGLYPADAKMRAVIDQWSYWQAVHLGPAVQRVVFERMMKPAFGMGEPDEKAVAGHFKEVDQFLPILDAGLAGKEWVVGALSLARLRPGEHVRLPLACRHRVGQYFTYRGLDRPDGGAAFLAGSSRSTT